MVKTLTGATAGSVVEWSRSSLPLAGERLRPLGHLSGGPVDKEEERHNQYGHSIPMSKIEQVVRFANASDVPKAIPYRFSAELAVRL